MWKVIVSNFAWTWKDFEYYLWRMKRPNILTWLSFTKGYRGPSIISATLGAGASSRKRGNLWKARVKMKPAARTRKTWKPLARAGPENAHSRRKARENMKPLISAGKWDLIARSLKITNLEKSLGTRLWKSLDLNQHINCHKINELIV